MNDRRRVTRRQILALGGVVAVGASVTGMSLRGAAAKAGKPQPQGMSPRDLPRKPCIGEPGYEDRVAELFKHADRKS